MNIRQVARRAGVSVATVSRTINGSEKVVPETAERVRRAIKELNYYPDTNARALGSGKSSFYGLIISDIANPFFPELVKNFEDVALEYGQEVLIANTNYDPKRMEECISRMLQRKVEGVAIMTSEMDQALLAEFCKREIPLVFLDTGKPGRLVSNILIDYAFGINAAIDHLVSLGHCSIGFLAGPASLASSCKRREAFLAGLKRKGRRLTGVVEEGNHRVDGGRAAMSRLLASRNHPVAVIASNDMTAIGALGAIRDHGLRVPQDISLIGFDDVEISAFLQPALTTVRLPRPQIARMAFSALFQANQSGKTEGSEFVIKPELIVRDSTRSIKRSGEEAQLLLSKGAIVTKREI